LPVSVGGKDTHVDFVLRTHEAFLVAECKRANPALANWCFARAPYIARRERASEVRLEQLRWNSTVGRAVARPMELPGVVDQYQVA
jgi:hypothetical protein